VWAVGQLQAATESLNRIGHFCQNDLQHPPGTEDPRAVERPSVTKVPKGHPSGSVEFRLR